MLYSTGSDAAAALAEASTPKISSEADAAGPPAFPAVPLEQYLDPSLSGLCDRIALALKEKNDIRGGGQLIGSMTPVGSSFGAAHAGNNAFSMKPSPLDSGQFDMSAFGSGFNGAGGNIPITTNTSGVPYSDGGFGSIMLPDTVQPQSPSQPSLKFSSAAMNQPAPSDVATASSMDTGMVDLSAFGMEMAPPPLPEAKELPQQLGASLAPTTSASNNNHNHIETGALDLASFGMGMDFTPATAAPAAAAAPPTASSSGAPPRPPFSTQSFSKNSPSAACSVPSSLQKGASVVMLSTAKQDEISSRDLPLFSPELVWALHRITGLVENDEESKLDEEESMDAFPPYSNRRDLSYLRSSSGSGGFGINSGNNNNNSSFVGQQQGGTSGFAAVESLRNQPKQPFPGLTIDETRQVLAIATFFSSNLAPISTSPIDEAGAAFLTALTLACARPEDPREPPLLPLKGNSSLSTNSRALISSISAKSSGGFGSIPSSASTAALLRRSRSVRNAAGVEYTLAPSMASAASLGGLSTDDDEEESRNEAQTLAQKWGLTSGLGLSAVMWGLMTNSPEALLGHALEKIKSRDAEIEAIVKAYQERAAEVAAAAGDTAGSGGGAGGQKDFLGTSSSSASGRLTWDALRDCGAGFWLRDPTLLASTAESLAKSRFAARRNPDDAALLYAALGKKSVLQGLYRSTNQTRQADFLARDFSQPRHQQAACKNAFVLLGNHRPELAAAFFILGKKRTIDLHVF